MEPTTYSSLHHAVAFLEREACGQWMNEYALGPDLELALAEHVRGVEVTYRRSQGGQVSVLISLECMNVHFNRQYYFILQRAGNRAYRRLEPASTQT